MVAEILTDRENAVLEAVILDFVQSAKPVGSRNVAKNSVLDVSAATIRNAMADLEDKGYLTHPHTSAGRIPTDKGYRYYVDWLMKISGLTKEERSLLTLEVDQNAQDVEEILKKTSRVLGQLSDELGIVLAPQFYQGILKKLELVEISSDKLLVVINIKSGIVKTVIIEVAHAIPRERLPDISQLLNERLAGLTLEEVKRTIDERFRDLEDSDDELIQMILEKSDSLFDFTERVDVHVSGAKNIVRQPELQDPEKMTSFMELVEQGEQLADLFQGYEDSTEDLFITIGSENKRAVISDYSIVASTYNYSGLTGTIAILGPKRMYYDRIAALVRVTANLISEQSNET
ncbi:MAG: heat-inducible transcriptional repressor HrcA [Candidatus Marinimicrobia bacterium]|nr:heat-inducible transcriptional repressor HrcA [Candidatus Neomarinimicrobiota bacterium]MCF7827706.1 heat-inducible transcriptional repressor HrcA [Candidatus Neomarinimicrobiota bacterium]MCF7881239.1 heat-inducible transcriptional repressor HrcA [Candidatus Neomarinimicrobiota bacterium]